jgi:hypothetical protein
MLRKPTYNPRRTVLAVAAALAAAAAVAPSSALAGGQTLYVSSSAASDPGCAAASKTNPFATLQGALACSKNGGTIVLDSGTFAGGVTVAVDVRIRGLGQASVIAGPAAATQPEVTVADGHTVTLERLTVDGGGQRKAVAAGSGALSVVDSTITGGFGDGPGAGIRVESAGGPARLTLLRSTVAGNFGFGSGAGIYVGNGQTVDVVGSTITGNEAATGAGGGGIALGQLAAATIRSSTIVGNTGQSGGGLYAGGGATVSLTNTILAGNHASTGPDCLVGSALVGSGHNVIGDGTSCGSATNGSNFDQVGSPAALVDPHLGPLADNGGPTRTFALLLGSPAIGTGDPAACLAAPVANVDQRGSSRKTEGRSACDVGAYDTGGKVLQLLNVKATAPSDPPCASASATVPFKTIAGALACSSNGTAIQVGNGTFDGGFTIDRNVTLQGNGSATVITGPVAAADSQPEVTVADGHWVTLRSLVVDGGGVQTGVTTGWGVVTVAGSTIRNSFGDLGGAIRVRPSGSAKLTVFRSTLSGNTAANRGGGVYAEARSDGETSVEIVNSTITGNDGGSAGGGVSLQPGAARTVRDSTIARNSANSSGGSLWASIGSTAPITLTNTILAANTTGSGDSPDCYAVRQIDGGHNVVGQADAECPSIGGLVGTPAVPLDPRLGPLANNGGTTRTLALLAGSPAIGNGDAAVCRLSPVDGNDQRGAKRNALSRGVCDIGAYDTGGVGG